MKISFGACPSALRWSECGTGVEGALERETGLSGGFDARIAGALLRLSDHRKGPDTVNMTSKTEEQAVQERWGTEDFQKKLERAFWMNHRIVRGHLNRLATGDAHCDWLTWFTHECLPTDRPQRVLVLGCGEGWLERSIARLPWIERIDACDVAEGAVARARERAQAEGLDHLHYETVDLNVAKLPTATYDAVIAHSVLHHVENLELAFAQIAGSLRGGGWVAINEFIGPRHLQYREDAMQAMNEVMAVLTERLRTSITAGDVLETKLRPALEYVLEVDPSEGVRADELDGFIRRTFEVPYEADMGGTMLQHLLWDLVGNFRENDPVDELLLEWICRLEETLVENGAMESDYRFYVCRPKGTAPGSPITRLEDSLQRRAPDTATPRSDAWRRTGAARRHFHLVATGDPDCDWLTKALTDAETLGVGKDARVLWFGEPECWMLDVARKRFASVERFRRSLLLQPWRSFDLVLAAGSSPWSGRHARRHLAALALLLRRDGVLLAVEPGGLDEAERELVEPFHDAMLNAVGAGPPEIATVAPSSLAEGLFFSAQRTGLGGGLLGSVLASANEIPEERLEEVVALLGVVERLLMDRVGLGSASIGLRAAGPRRGRLLLGGTVGRLPGR